MTEKIWTITALLDTTKKFLSDKGCESARLDAELLLAHALEMPRLHLYLNFDRPLTAPELNAYRNLVKRRAAREPVAYITGQKEFYSRPFKVTRDVLIPRPETEILVEEVLKCLKSDPPSPRAKLHGLEIGLGSGCIAITLLCECPDLKMTAIEISPAAAKIARENAKTHKVEERLQIVVADFLNDNWKDWLPQSLESFDFLISNPPYATTEEIKKLMPDVRDHEPHLALDGGNNGLDFYRLIAQRAKDLMKSKGLIAVEIGENQGQSVPKIFSEHDLKNIKVIKDYAGLDRVVRSSQNWRD